MKNRKADWPPESEKLMSGKTEAYKGTRSQTIDAIKGAAILLVMAGHVLVWNHMEDGYVYDVIKVIQMPLFIMVSGYLCGIGRTVQGPSDYGRILGKRALAYLTPFFFWIILLHPLHPVSSVIQVLFDLDEGLWFLMTLFLLTAMIYTAQLAESGVRKWRSKKADADTSEGYAKAAFWLVYLALAAFVVLETLLGWEFLSPGLTRLYLPFYLIGYLAGKRKEWLRELPETVKRLACAVSLLGLILMAAVWDLQDVSTLFLLGRQLFASLLGCLGVSLLLKYLKDGRLKRFLAFLGGYTLEIYVLHFHFATVLNQGKAYSLYTWEGLCFAAASFVVMSVITAVIIIVTKKFWLLDFLLYGKWKKGALKKRADR